MSLSNYTFDKDEHSLALVTFTSPDGGGYQDQCGVVWNGVSCNWKEINGRFYMFQQVEQARFDLGNDYQNIVKFEAGQDFTFECFFLLDDKTKPRETPLAGAQCFFSYQSFDTNSNDWGESRMFPWSCQICEDGTNQWARLPYQWQSNSLISTEQSDSIYKRGCINHWACVRYNNSIKIYCNGIAVAKLDYNRKMYNSTGNAGIHSFYSLTGWQMQDTRLGLSQYHISNTARYTDEFQYTPKIIYGYDDDNILKVY